MRTYTKSRYTYRTGSTGSAVVYSEMYIGDSLGRILQEGDKVAWIRHPSRDPSIVSGYLQEIIEQVDNYGFTHHYLVCVPDKLSEDIQGAKRTVTLEIGVDWTPCRDEEGIPVYAWDRVLKLQE